MQAVKRMLPGNRLSRKADDQPCASMPVPSTRTRPRTPTVLDVKSMNPKNTEARDHGRDPYLRSTS